MIDKVLLLSFTILILTFHWWSVFHAHSCMYYKLIVSASVAYYVLLANYECDHRFLTIIFILLFSRKTYISFINI